MIAYFPTAKYTDDDLLKLPSSNHRLVLQALTEHPGLTSRELSKRLRLDQYVVIRCFRWLESTGYIVGTYISS